MLDCQAPSKTFLYQELVIFKNLFPKDHDLAIMYIIDLDENTIMESDALG